MDEFIFSPLVESQPGVPVVFEKLWLYTNYDCNLSCAYCLAKSTPGTPRRALGLANVRRLVDEAVVNGFREVFFTGGEPLILEDIYAMLAYSTERIKTCLLTNAMLVKGRRLERLKAVNHPNLTVQVSLDGAQPEQHDVYRGAGTFAPTLEGLRRLQENGFHVRLSTTETPANSAHLGEICEFHKSLGIPEGDHVLRTLAKRGFSQEGIELSTVNMQPEVTVDIDGVYWHPLSTDSDMRVSWKMFPLADSLTLIREQLAAQTAGEAARVSFT